MSKAYITKQMLEFLRERKKYWLMPVVLLLMVLGMVLVFAQGSAVAPFIYALF